VSAGAVLNEAAALPWRELRSERSLVRLGRLWTAWTAAIGVQFLIGGAVLLAIEPLTLPVALACFAHGWIIPELYAFRGASTVTPKGRRNATGEKTAQGLLGDLLSHRERELQRETGLALERGTYGVWLIGEGGALLVAPGGRRVHCFCVRVTDPELPPSDRIAHLLLALRSDEAGFTTVANHAFAGAPWRVRRRLPREMRPALAAARAAAA
jgi:hypothetical protein